MGQTLSALIQTLSATKSIVETCHNKGHNISSNQCHILFNSSSGNVAQFGTISPGGFKGDPDIAGEGVFIAFIVPSVIISFYGLLLTAMRLIWPKLSNSQENKTSIRNRLRKASKHSRWMHAVCDEVMLSAADTQLLLIFAFGTSFYLTSQCDVSLYHYLIAVNMILVGLTTSALSYTLARNSYKSYLSLVVRVGLFMIDYVGLTRTLDNNNFEENDRFLQRVPGNGQKDSIIVLPAFCLLDKSYDPMGDLQPSEQLHLAHTGLNRNTNFQIYAILVVGVIAFGGTILHIAYLVWEKKFRFVLWTDKFGDHTNLTAYTRDRPGLLKLLTGLWWVARFGIWAVCTIFIIWNWASIILLRRWINGSVWLELEDGANPERGVQEIGQMTPLVAAFGAIVLTFLNSLSEVLSRHTSSNGDEKTKKLTANGSYIQIQPKNHQEYTQV